MNPILLLKYLPYAIGVLIIGALLFLLYRQGEKAGEAKITIVLEQERSTWNNERAKAAEDAASASEAYRAKEQSDREKLDKVQADGQAQITAATIARDAADKRATSLRATATAALNSLRRATPEAPATPAECLAADTAARVFRDLFGRCDEVAGVLASYADAARVAGNVCVSADQVTR